MRAVFGEVGKEDRAGGTRAAPAGSSGGGGLQLAAAGGAGEAGRGKGGKLAASSEVHTWSGSLEFNSEGLLPRGKGSGGKEGR
jgi:hypothetical protein